jgi:hypothetical protein
MLQKCARRADPRKPEFKTGNALTTYLPGRS